MEDAIQSAYQKELQKLSQVHDSINMQLEALRAIPRYYGPDPTEQSLDVMREKARQSLAIAENEPYFGRIDFQESGGDSAVPLYIGKAGVEDPQTGKPLIIDWRAPVASLFYSFTGGKGPTEYESPEGLINGFVYLKRNLVIRQQILQRIVDTYVRGSDNLGVSDEFLLFRLGENKDNKLRDIVSTIQSEQDRIIRAAKNKALIIQGAAGSGKTTVALHRIAYLLYQYREQVRADRMIIFAPNRMFIDYISGVLPELGVGDIQQMTFEDWALDRLHDPLTIMPEGAELERRFAIRPADSDNNKSDSPARLLSEAEACDRYRGSAHFAKRLDQVLDLFEAEYIGNADFVPWEGASLPATTIRHWFYVENKHDPLAKRRERLIARMKRWLEIELENAWEVHLKKERKKQGNAKLKAFVKNWSEPSPLQFYRGVLEKGSREGWLSQEWTSEVLRYLKKKKIKSEDLAPLLYIHNRFHGVSGNDRFDHIVIDEAQDYSPFQIALLRQHSRNDSFTILGDLAQGIHDYKGIHRWNEFEELFAKDHTELFHLNQSYRSTMEIIEFANRILAASNVSVQPAVPVFRSGKQVLVNRVDSDRDKRMSAIADSVRKLQEGEVSTLAVIARTDKECRIIHSALEAEGFSPALITADQRSYAGGLSVLPVYLSKGFEFDAVLIVDADEHHYTNNPRDAKLLYVACTRALHRLWLHYSGNSSLLL